MVTLAGYWEMDIAGAFVVGMAALQGGNDRCRDNRRAGRIARSGGTGNGGPRQKK
ncbi:hypothetical protein GMPD_31410 [Geomonas paludis]|uniref:Uncharacterized protein n=1 Tax=Geomonas paludis TaxID=2740185 RepID=A0A6V8MYM0_9BACT|nr:hypothetical protein GMPD_31410 [Geomonas paludis]